MDRTIVVSSALRERFKTAWEQRQIIFFSAPCGFGKSAAASALLEGYKVCCWDAMDSGTAERTADVSYDAVLMDRQNGPLPQATHINIQVLVSLCANNF